MTVAQQLCGIESSLQTHFGHFINDLMNQVKYNQFNLYNRTYKKVKGKEYKFDAVKGFQKLGPTQVANWSVPPFADNPQYVLATFKIKFQGNPVGMINVTVEDVTEGFSAERLEALVTPLTVTSIKYM